MRVLLILALFLCGCATKPKLVNFTRPSSVAVSESISRVNASVSRAVAHAQGAKTSIDKAKASTAALAAIVSVPEAVPIVKELSLELDAGNSAIDLLTKELLEAKSESNVSALEVQKLDAQVEKQTVTLREVATTNNDLRAENLKLEAQKARWRKIAMHWRIIAGLVISGVALYFFGPSLLMLARRFISPTI